VRIGGKLQPCTQMQAANTFMKKRRAGVAEPAGGLEAYFIPPGALSDAMLQVPTPAGLACRCDLLRRRKRLWVERWWC
jgi:hypothetical protein